MRVQSYDTYNKSEEILYVNFLDDFFDFLMEKRKSGKELFITPAQDDNNKRYLFLKVVDE